MSISGIVLVHVLQIAVHFSVAVRATVGDLSSTEVGTHIHIRDRFRIEISHEAVCSVQTSVCDCNDGTLPSELQIRPSDEVFLDV